MRPSLTLVLVVGSILFLGRSASGETLVERLERGCQIETKLLPVRHPRRGAHTDLSL